MIVENIKIKRGMSYHKRPRRTKSTCASPPFDSAKVIKNSETAKENLKKLSERYKGINQVKGFLNDLWTALGISNQGELKKGGKPSRYALFQLKDGTLLNVSIRASAHNANANRYIEHPPVPDVNVSIVLQKRMKKNQFRYNPNVNLAEFVYVNNKIQKVKDPLSQIANSLIHFIDTGEYVDTTGVAITHGDLQAPQNITKENKQYNTKNKMKRRIRLTEGMLHRMIKEAINELDWKTYKNAADLAKKRKMSDRARNFRDAARKAFDRDFGFEDETGKVNSIYGVWDSGDAQLHAQKLDSNGNVNGTPKCFITNQNFYGQNGSHTPGKWCVGTVGWSGAIPVSPDFDTEEEAEAYANEHHLSIEVVEPSKELQAAFQRARKEAADFDTRSPSGLREPSNYEYEKGKGWKLINDSLDESIHRAIRRVLR